jgi:hypothetical protein
MSAGRGDLVVGLRVHEVVPVAVLVKEVVVAVVDEGALHLLGGAVALGHLHPVGDAAHVQLGHRRALAGVNVFDAQDDVELAVDINGVPFPERAGRNLHRRDPSVSKRSGSAAGRGRT